MRYLFSHCLRMLCVPALLVMSSRYHFNQFECITLLMLQHFRLFICQIQVHIFRLIYLRSYLLTALKKLRLRLFTPIYTTVINNEYSSNVSYLPPSDLGSIDLVL